MREIFFTGRRESLDPFNDYRMIAMRPIIRTLFIVVICFNTMVLIPEMLVISGERAVAVAVLRLGFTILALAAFFWVIRMKHFRVYAALITTLEIISIAIFLLVYALHPAPDFSSRTLGMMVCIILVFLTPNDWVNMNVVAWLGNAGFLLTTMLTIPGLTAGKIAMNMIYLTIVSVVGALIALHMRAYQYREYVSRTDLLRDYATDPLTQLGNRVRLEEEAARWMDWSSKYGVPLSLVVMDVDNMKQVNDTYGHIKGDAVLCQIAEELCATLRKNDVCVRWGGDEFIFILPNTELREAEKLTFRVQNAIHSRVFDPPVKLSCSFGIALMQPGMSLNALIERADQSMYEAKKRNSKKTGEHGVARM